MKNSSCLKTYGKPQTDFWDTKWFSDYLNYKLQIKANYKFYVQLYPPFKTKILVQSYYKRITLKN